MVASVSGPLVVVEKTADVKYDELVEVLFSDGRMRRGKVLEVDGNLGPQPARPMRLDQIANATCQRVEWHGTAAIAAVAVGA